MQRRSLLALSAVTALAIAFAGCSKSHVSAPPEAGFGRVTIALTDAPANVEHVYLDVREVWVHRLNDGSGGDGLTAADDPHHLDGALPASGGDDDRDHDGDHYGDHEPDEDGVWHALDTDTGIIDLLELQNGVFFGLAAGRVPAGTYDEIRLKLGPNNSIVVDGAEHPLVVPSGQTSGYKLKGTFHVPIEDVVEVGLDFDADRSVHLTGSDKWMLKPVCRIHEITTTGRISGRIDPGSATSRIYALQDPDTIATTQSAGDGYFLLSLLPPGDYMIRVTPIVEGFRDTLLGPVHVVVGETTDLGTIELGGGPVTPPGGTGSVSGTVVPGDVTTWVVLLDSADAVVDSVATESPTGAFSFQNVVAGTYGLVLKPPVTYESRFFGPFTVTAGANHDVGAIYLSPAAGGAAMPASRVAVPR